jgi:hypothetical protein
MRVRLTRRLASRIDGVNLAAHHVGDVFDVPRHDADLLIAEEWAVPVAATESYPRQTSHQSLGPLEQRRAEDRFREELRDSRSTTISKNPA